MRDRGSMLVFTVLVGLAFTAAILVALVPWLDHTIDARRAQHAADAAALAGVTGGRSASAELADVNGATLIAWSRSGSAVTVTVRVDDQDASARATDGP